MKEGITTLFNALIALINAKEGGGGGGGSIDPAVIEEIEAQIPKKATNGWVTIKSEK